MAHLENILILKKLKISPEPYLINKFQNLKQVPHE